MSDMTQTPAKTALQRRLPILVIAVAALLGLFFLRDFLSFEALQANREALLAFRDANYLVAVLSFMAVYVVIVAFSLPGAAIATFAGGFMFATFPGAAYNVIAATIGATAIFSAARMGFGDQLAAKMESSDGLVKKIKDGIDENQWSMLFLIRFIPVVPFFVANLVPALVDVPLRRYVISTFLGIIPGSIVFTSVGAGLGEVFASGDAFTFSVLKEPALVLPLLGLCALSLFPVILKAVRGKEGI